MHNEPEKLSVRLEFDLDPFGTPIALPVPNAELAASIETGRSMADEPAEFSLVRVSANRPGLLWLAQKCLALAHSRSDAEDLGFHVHAVDPKPADANPVALVIDLVRTSGAGEEP